MTSAISAFTEQYRQEVCLLSSSFTFDYYNSSRNNHKNNSNINNERRRKTEDSHVVEQQLQHHHQEDEDTDYGPSNTAEGVKRSNVQNSYNNNSNNNEFCIATHGIQTKIHEQQYSAQLLQTSTNGDIASVVPLCNKEFGQVPVALQLLISQNIIQRNVHPGYVTDTLVDRIYNKKYDDENKTTDDEQKDRMECTASIATSKNDSMKSDCHDDHHPSNTDRSGNNKQIEIETTATLMKAARSTMTMKNTPTFLLPICYCCGGPIQPGLLNCTIRIHPVSKRIKKKKMTTTKDSTMNNNDIPNGAVTTTNTKMNNSTIRRRQSRKKAKFFMREQQQKRNQRQQQLQQQQKQRQQQQQQQQKLQQLQQHSDNSHNLVTTTTTQQQLIMEMPTNEKEKTNLFRFCYEDCTTLAGTTSSSARTNNSNTVSPPAVPTMKNYATVRCGICNNTNTNTNSYSSDGTSIRDSCSNSRKYSGSVPVIIIPGRTARPLPRKIPGIPVVLKADVSSSSSNILNNRKKSLHANKTKSTKNLNASATPQSSNSKGNSRSRNDTTPTTLRTASTVHNRIAVGSYNHTTRGTDTKKRKMEQQLALSSTHSPFSTRASEEQERKLPEEEFISLSSLHDHDDHRGHANFNAGTTSAEASGRTTTSTSTKQFDTTTKFRKITSTNSDKKKKYKKNDANKKNNPLMDFLSSLNG